MYVDMYVCIPVCVYTRMCVDKYVCRHMHLRTHMYVVMCVYTHICVDMYDTSELPSWQARKKQNKTK